jgi:hypothetical protein
VQDGLTLAREKAIRFSDGKIVFDKTAGKTFIQQSLSNNNIKVQSLNIWYANGRIYASGKTAEGTPFTFSIQVHKNFR